MAFELTPLGESEATKIVRKTGPETAVLSYMYEMYASHEPVELEDIMRETRMTEEKALKVLRHLTSGGYIEET